jgi:hypothetical protein
MGQSGGHPPGAGWITRNCLIATGHYRGQLSRLGKVLLMEFIGDHRGLFIVIGLLGLIASVGYIYLHLGKKAPASEPQRTPTPIPTARPSQQRTPSLEVGQTEHALRGQAKTVKVEPPCLLYTSPSPRDH